MAIDAARLEPLEDKQARDLYERHARRVLAYCRSRLRRREDAEDAVQTTFLHAVNNLRRGDRPSHELAWLLGIARNVCLSRLETAGRRGRLELVCDPVDLERSEAPSGRSDELIGLEDALARLPEQQRRAVLLRDWRGLSYEEVASQLGVSLANAETLIFRGRRSLAALLDEQPAATRRRLASLGNTGSLLAWTKASFGGSVAAKLAAAAVVVAVSGAGVAAGTGVLDREPPAPSRAPAQPLVTPAAQGQPASPEATRVATSTRERTGAQPAAHERSIPPRAVAPATSTPTAQAPFAATPEQQQPGPSATEPRGVLPKPEQAAPAAKSAVGATVAGVADTVERAVPPLAPVTDTVVAVVESVPIPALPVDAPPVTVTPPAPLPAEPIVVDPPKLLP